MGLALSGEVAGMAQASGLEEGAKVPGSTVRGWRNWRLGLEGNDLIWDGA